MKRVRILAHGGPEVLQFEEVPSPEEGTPDEVAPGGPASHRGGPKVSVRVTHVGLNHLDLWVRRGVPGHRFPLPLVPGSDVAGVRLDTGATVVLQPGLCCGRCARCLEGEASLCRSYRIRGETTDGGLTEQLRVPADELLETHLAPERAAALPLGLLTAWHMLQRAGLRPGDRVLVQAGAGGVAHLALQVARALGARVAATASTPAKRALCLQLGAERAWSYEEATQGVREWTAREGVDVVVEHVGAATFDLSLRALRWGGTLVTCGATAGHQVPLDLRALFFKQLRLVGSTMGSPAELARAWTLAEDGRVRPVLDRVLPWSDLAQAHALLESRAVVGKVVLAVG